MKSGDPSKVELFPFILNEACPFWLRWFQLQRLPEKTPTGSGKKVETGSIFAVTQRDVNLSNHIKGASSSY